MEKADIVSMCDCLDARHDRMRTAMAAFALRRERRNHEHTEATAHAQIHSDGKTRRVTRRTADSTRRRGRR